jgi:hypothetical protein
MLKHRASGVSGHVHRPQTAEFVDGEGIHTIWRSIGHCCDMQYVDYVKGANWKLHSGKMTVSVDGTIEWTDLTG